MPDNRQNQNNIVFNSVTGPVDNVEEGIRKMKIENGNGNWDEKGGGESSPPYPDRPGEPDCIYYLRTGSCGYGSTCRFNHPLNAPKSVQSKGELPQRAGQPDCGFYLKTGTCKYGASCKFHHPNDRVTAEPAPLNFLGLPIRKDTKCCPHYMRTNTCKFGVGCKFNHPQSSPAESGLTVPPGASAYGAMNSSVYPSDGMPYANGLSTWLLPRSPYLLGPRVPSPPAYAPIVIPSSQGVMTAHGWSTCVGTMAPTNIYATSIYNTKDQEALGMNVPYNSSGKMLGLPERPDQPECRYFMSNGSCKYGFDCKYHHPKERIAELPMYSLGYHGLPLRPGEAMCSHFRMHGVCKYGAACKFDHPITGYVPTSGFFQHFVTRQRNSSSIKNYSESSPSKSAKISDWIQKPEPVEDNNNGYPDGGKSAENLKESADHPTHEPTTATTTTSEAPRDH